MQHSSEISIFVIQGAPEGIVDRCNFVRVGQEKLPLTPEVKSQIMKLIGEYGTGSDTLRCLALATVDEPLPRDQMDLQVNIILQLIVCKTMF